MFGSTSSPHSDRKMKILIGLILGLFASVQTTPTVTQIPIKAEDDFVREAVTDGFIVQQFFHHSLTTEPPKQNITVQPMVDSYEGSGDLTSAPSVTPEHSTVSQTTHFAITSFLDDGSGSGEEAYPDQSTTTSPSEVVSSYTESLPMLSTSELGVIEQITPVEESGSGSGDGTLVMAVPAKERSFSPLGTSAETNEPKEIKGHVTPDWIIILGFIVGVAALIMLCVAIATRDKWNGPRPTSQPQTRIEVSHQPREVEMETFLHKDSPKENGKAAEYTVIPLEDLPHNYSD